MSCCLVLSSAPSYPLQIPTMPPTSALPSTSWCFGSLCSYLASPTATWVVELIRCDSVPTSSKRLVVTGCFLWADWSPLLTESAFYAHHLTIQLARSLLYLHYTSRLLLRWDFHLPVEATSDKLQVYSWVHFHMPFVTVSSRVVFLYHRFCG